MNKLFVVIFPLLAFIVSCAPTIKGEIVENDQPLEGVTVQILNSDKITKSDKNGQFSLNYDKGDVSIKVSKDGYLNVEQILGVKSGDVVLEKIKMISIPQKQIDEIRLLNELNGLIIFDSFSLRIKLSNLCTNKKIEIIKNDLDKNTGIMTLSGFLYATYEYTNAFGLFYRNRYKTPFNANYSIDGSEWKLDKMETNYLKTQIIQ